MTHTDAGALLNCATCRYFDPPKESETHGWCQYARLGANVRDPANLPMTPEGSCPHHRSRQAASHGREGGEAVASPQEVQEACAQVADRTALRCIREQIPGDATATFIAKAIRALIPPVKTGGDAETLEQIEAEARRYAEMYPQSSDGRNTFVIFADWVAALPKLTTVGENERYRVDDPWCRPAAAKALMDLINPDVLMNVVNAKINDYVELHNRGDLTEHGEHGWLVLTNLRRDMEFAIKRRSPEASSAHRGCGDPSCKDPNCEYGK